MNEDNKKKTSCHVSPSETCEVSLYNISISKNLSSYVVLFKAFYIDFKASLYSILSEMCNLA